LDPTSIITVDPYGKESKYCHHDRNLASPSIVPLDQRCNKAFIFIVVTVQALACGTESP
jgi:hypothetical protein